MGDQPRIGIELHIQLNTRSKLFCSCSTEPADPNTNLCPTCLGLPGAKPVLNKKALQHAIVIGHILNAKFSKKLFFSRKTYFYPDMPKNYQITQYEFPLAKEGFFTLSPKFNKKISIMRINIEEDPGKLTHVGGSIISAKYVLIDYNRAGLPLCEIVTAPDFNSPLEVRDFLKNFLSSCIAVNVFDPSKNTWRVDVNISFPEGARIEIKNISGIKAVEKALSYEIIRQKTILRDKGEIRRETRHFDSFTKRTYILRKKETAEDYGYIFEPNLVCYELSDEMILSLKKQLVNLPYFVIKEMVKKYKIPREVAEKIVHGGKELRAFFEECVEHYSNPTSIANWILTDFLKCVHYQKIQMNKLKCSPSNVAELVKMVDNRIITPIVAKEIMKKLVATGIPPKEILSEKKLKHVDPEKLVEDILKKFEIAVIDYKKGKRNALNYLVGKCLKESNLAVDPNEIRKIILNKIGE